MVDKGATCYHSEPLKRLSNSPLRSGEHHCKPDSKKPSYFLYPHITAILVLAYLNRDTDTSRYDSTTYPPLENVPPRYTIVRRNEWMVRESDMVISVATHGWGGAAKTLDYARRRQKVIFQFPTHQG